LENLIKSAVIVAGQGGELVNIGSKVGIQKEGEKDTRIYTIVGSEESDMSIGKISNISPLGSSLIGKRKNDTVNVNTPKGKISYKLISVE
jgi:transcription elongation factor GreA